MPSFPLSDAISVLKRCYWLRGPALIICCANLLISCAGSLRDNPLPLFRSTVMIKSEFGHAAGFIVAKDRVLTVSHIVRTASPPVDYMFGQSHQAKVIWRDEDRDLALLDVEVPEEYGAVPLNCQDVVQGQYLKTIGHPLDARWTLTGGYFIRPDMIDDDEYELLDITLGLGTAGGPVFNSRGQVAGMVQALAVKPAEGTIWRATPYAQMGLGLMRTANSFCDDVKRALSKSGAKVG